MKKIGYVQVYTGFGKGKSSAAFGLLLRAVAHDWKIFVAQYMKGDPLFDYGEIRSCEKFKDNVLVYQSRLETHHVIKMLENDKEAIEICQRKIKYAWSRTMNIIADNKFDLVIMDEILPVLNNKLLDIINFKDFIENKPDLLEVTLTGRMNDPDLINYIELIADYYTDLKLVKHPYNKQCPKCKKIFIDDQSSYLGCPYCMEKLVQVYARKGVEF